MLKIMMSSLKTRNNADILNVGAATGASSVMLGEFGKVVSLEYDKDCCAFVKEKTGMEFINASITELPFATDSFDVVCAFDVIEHVEDHEQAAKELIRVCKPEGYILTTVPAYRFLWSHHDEVNQHVRRYTRKEFKNLFIQQTQTTYSGYFNFLLFPLIAFLRLSDKFLKIKKLRRDAGSDFSIIKNESVNNFFFRIMNSERFFIRNRISIPFGVSIMHACRKNK